MANYCSYDLRVVGNSEDVEQFANILQRKKEKYIARVFCADEVGREKREEGLLVLDFYGNCAWSVATSMMERGYYRERRKNDPNCTCLEKAARDLNLEIEVYSTEPGFCFAEHVRIDRGDVIEDECVDYTEYFFDPESQLDQIIADDDMERFCETDDPDFVQKMFEYWKEKEVDDKSLSWLKLEDLEEGAYYRVGGFPDWEFII